MFQLESEGEEGGSSHFAAGPALAKQDSEVLTGGNQVSLDPLTPEPAPAGALEPMAIGGIRETSFHEMASAFAICPSLGTG